MRGSLSGVRSRVDRLALKLGPLQAAGCASCRGQEDTPRVLCVYGDEIPDIPSEVRCEACERLIPLRHMIVRYDANMKPNDMT
jgi:NAD-dependent SIR2 family protein deacetylase